VACWHRRLQRRMGCRRGRPAIRQHLAAPNQIICRVVLGRRRTEHCCGRHAYRLAGADRPQGQNTGTVRALLGARQSSVFSIPSRCAVYAGADPHESDERKRFLHACALARATSAQGRAVAKQGFHIFRKIVDVDTFLQQRRDVLGRVFEVHPEVAFWRMNGSTPVPEPKKIKGKLNQTGIELRARLLVAAGIPANCIDIALPKPVGRDDWVDALAALVVARRLPCREAISFPSPPEIDRLGIPIAIWA
jgi:predicted RNase H-like nuclease